MARPKKTTAEKKAPSARKDTTPKKTTAKTADTKALGQTAGLQSSMRMLAAAPSTRRPPSNPSTEVPQTTIDQINNKLNQIKNVLDDYSAHLRALDRRRLNGVGVRKLGFIERAYEIALENSEFLPHYLSITRFGEDIQYFMEFRTLVDLTTQVREKLWNITMQTADIAYTDALEFYASAREAAKRRVDAAETIFNELSIFFKSRGRRPEEEGGEPTEKQLKRDADSLIRGRHDGRLVIENISPKLTGGKRKVIDQTFRDTAEFKDTEEGKFEE